jgi:hypothetical protein
VLKKQKAFAMGNWEKNKKDSRRLEDREQNLQFQDHKKKKLKPTEKEKYRLKPVVKYEEDEEE